MNIKKSKKSVFVISKVPVRKNADKILQFYVKDVQREYYRSYADSYLSDKLHKKFTKITKKIENENTLTVLNESLDATSGLEKSGFSLRIRAVGHISSLKNVDTFGLVYYSLGILE